MQCFDIVCGLTLICKTSTPCSIGTYDLGLEHDVLVPPASNAGTTLNCKNYHHFVLPSTANLWCATFQHVDDLYAAALTSVGWQSPSQKYVGSKAKER